MLIISEVKFTKEQKELYETKGIRYATEGWGPVAGWKI